MLARLAIAQFVQVCSSLDANSGIFKGLVIDEAGRYVDDDVARGVQRIRSRNAVLIPLAQALAEFPADLLPVIFASVGCKAVFAGANPQDARYYADFWGTRWVGELAFSSMAGHADSATPAYKTASWGEAGASSTQHPEVASRSLRISTGASVRQVERQFSASAGPGHHSSTPAR